MINKHLPVIALSAAALLFPLASIPAAPVAAKKPRGEAPAFKLTKPKEDYLKKLKDARDSQEDYFYKDIASRPEGATYENVKDLIAPIRYTDAPWRYAGLILSPKGSTQKMRMIENGFRIDANLVRRTKTDKGKSFTWAAADTYVTVCVGPKDEIFGLDESSQSEPFYEDGYLPVVHAGYTSEGTTYEETVFAQPLMAEYRSPLIDEPGIAAYIQVTAKSGPGQVSFEVVGPDVAYGFPIVVGGFRNDQITDGHNNILAYFSSGGTYDAAAKLVRFNLKQGESAYVVLPHQLQLAGTRVKPSAQLFEKARAANMDGWKKELSKGGTVSVPEKVVMDAYRSLLIGDMQLSIGDELPYGMFTYYQGNGYAETPQYIGPFIEYGYFEDAKRFIQPILEYPLSDDGIGLHVCANRLELVSYYYDLSGDADFVRKNKDRLIEVADYFLSHRSKDTGLLLDGYGFDVSGHRVVNINTNSNGWRGIRNLGLMLQAIGDEKLGQKYLQEADTFGKAIRKAVFDSINKTTQPPFVPFALLEKELYKSLVESKESSYYNLVMPYFFESEIFDPKAEPYTYTLDYMWQHQGIMAGLTRFNQHSTLPAQDGIHPLYTWGHQFNQIARHDTARSIYTFYCSLAFGYTRGTFVTGECQGAAPDPNEYYRMTYLPPEPPANALLLRSLRHMLIHEQDPNQNGSYNQLWLLSSAPQAWLEDGKSIALDRMPTRSGPISLKLNSAIGKGTIAGEVTLDKKAEKKEILLFVRVPRGYKVDQATLDGGAALKQSMMDGDCVLALPPQAGTAKFTIKVSRA